MSVTISLRSSVSDNFDGSTVINLERCTYVREGDVLVVSCVEPIGIVPMKTFYDRIVTEFKLSQDIKALNLSDQRADDILLERILFTGAALTTAVPSLVSPPTLNDSDGVFLVTPAPTLVATVGAFQFLYGGTGRIGDAPDDNAQGPLVFPKGYQLGLLTTDGNTADTEVLMTLVPFGGVSNFAALFKVNNP